MKKYFVFIFSKNQDSFDVRISDESYETNIQEHYPSSKLVLYEIFYNKEQAEQRFREIQSWINKKIKLIVDLFNPRWDDWSNQLLNN